MIRLGFKEIFVEEEGMLWKHLRVVHQSKDGVFLVRRSNRWMEVVRVCNQWHYALELK